ncbi:hypothetical protein BSQ44_00575 [Aquibium oceanicum]|uniref:Band 7 domain-containing protein n=2 Tax=Aquibium oceanicum TaxID=1670800 RepID=A0A1L3SKX5_9HYPH|nr:hypothetical protein BSQ44_00575 [Aquibium oceanicum]
MFGEIIAELQRRLPVSIIRNLRRISELRAAYAHLSDAELHKFQMAPDFSVRIAEFQDAVLAVQLHLNSASEQGRQVGEQTNRSLPAHISFGHPRMETGMFSEWIIRQPINSMPILMKKPLHRDCFVVFTNKGAPHSVAPVSNGFVEAQAKSFFCDGAIGIAKELSYNGHISGELSSSDGIPIAIGFHAHFLTIGNKEEPILEIARESQTIMANLSSAMDRSVRRYITQTRFDDLTNNTIIDRHEDGIRALLTEPLRMLRTVELHRFTLTELQSGTPSVKSQSMMEFEKRRRSVEEEEAERLRSIRLAQERQMLEIGQEARLSEAEVEAAVISVRAEAMRKSGEYSLSQDQIFEIFRDRLKYEARVEVAKQGREQWIAVGALGMLDRIGLGDSRVRVLEEKLLRSGDKDEEDDEREAF